MKTATKTLIAAALSLAGLSAFAQNADQYSVDVQTPPKTSSLTREQVRAELMAARRSGELDPMTNYDVIMARQAPSHAVGLTREQVRASVLAARRSGELDPTVSYDTITSRPAVPHTAVSDSLAQSR